ncbi:SMP-30/gluconolactonase/LRE family protein [Paractinoplanes globisporus]|uniref:SMP-30/gluconolactonase/LRE family protein n=1 Tax=Paractinoplanes globisporus TaxID=113565 RepID=A0ABW6WRA9_9ACTN|nr:SMP-30/gluconolactonase/LRE family protein [Actinoplanes globisporus]
MAEPRVVLTGIVMGESVRWHDGKLWFCDWAAGEVIRLDSGEPTVVTRMTGLPFCIDWLPGGELLILDGPGARLLRDGAEHADLSPIDGAHPWNDIAADSRGNAFVNNIGYDFPAGPPAPGLVAVVTPDGKARPVADGLLFPNGMAVTPDDATLIVAESHAARLTAFDIAPDGTLSNRRVWADLPGSAPDGICLDATGAVWYADVPNQHCRRVREGGEVLATIPLPDGAFDCALTDDQQTLYAVTADYTDPQAMFTGHTGRLFEISLAAN